MPGKVFEKRGKEKDDGYDDSANGTGSVDDADSWGEWTTTLKIKAAHEVAALR